MKMKIIRDIKRPQIVISAENLEAERVYLIDIVDGCYEIAATHLGDRRRVLYRAPSLTSLVRLIGTHRVEKIYL